MQENIKMPSAYEAERYIIGCLLIYDEMTEEILSQVSSKDFYFPENKVIMEAIETISSHGPIDQTTIIDSLKANNKLEAAGGLDNIYAIVAEVPSMANVDAYSYLIYNKSIERKLLKVVDDIRENILKGDYDHDQLMIESEKKFTEVVKNQSKDELTRVDLLTEEIIEYIEKNKERGSNIVGLDTGYPELNKLTSGFKPGELIILAARPAVGKSTFALNIAENMCKKKKSVAYFSLEMGYDQLIMRMNSTFSGVNLSKIVSGDLTDDDMALILQGKNDIDKMSLYIDQSSTTSLRDIRVKCQKLFREGKLDAIFIDYLQLMNSGENRANRVDEVGRISRGLKEMARSFNVPVVALSQLSRSIEQREDKTPVLADLRESGSIEQDADIVMFIHRDNPKKDTGEPDTTRMVYSAKTKIIVAKNRQGMTGDFTLVFKGQNSAFNSIEEK